MKLHRQCLADSKQNKERNDLRSWIKNNAPAVNLPDIFKKKFIKDIDWKFNQVYNSNDYAIIQRYMMEVNCCSTTGLYIIGPTGTGKSHMIAMVHRKSLYRGILGLYATEDEIKDSIATKFGGEPEHFDKYKKAFVLSINDFAKHQMTDAFHSEYEALIDYRYNKNLVTHITSNIPIEMAVTIVGNRIMDRLNERTTLLEFGGDSYREYIKQKIENEEVVPF